MSPQKHSRHEHEGDEAKELEDELLSGLAQVGGDANELVDFFHVGCGLLNNATLDGSPAGSEAGRAIGCFASFGPSNTFVLFVPCLEILAGNDCAQEVIMKKPHFNESFIYRFKQLLRRARLSQKELADDAGLSLGTLKGIALGKKSAHTERAVVEALNRKLGTFGAGKTITAEYLFAEWNEQPAATMPRRESRRPKLFQAEELPDLLTPGVPRAQLHKFYSKHVGAELATLLMTRSLDAIAAVEDGDFAKQTKLGQVIAEAGAEFPQIEAVGKYFMGEGLRLQGDSALGVNERNRFYRDATLRYHEAMIANPADPRAMRGMARIEERQDKFDLAEQKFEEAEGMTISLKAKTGSNVARFYLHHELLRVMRHKIHCLIDMRARSPANKWNTVRKTSELIGMVMRAENAHHELMGSFTDRPRWSQIEWFMGLVFLAKAWGSLGQREELYLALLHGLAARRALLPRTKPLDKVERMNLLWWVDVASSFEAQLDPKFFAAVQRLKGALSLEQHHEAIRQIDGIVSRLQPNLVTGLGFNSTIIV